MNTAESMNLLVAAAGNQITAARERRELEQCLTADLKLCSSCAHKLRTGDKFCRRCGARQPQDCVTAPMNNAERAARYRTATLRQLGAYRRVSGSLVGGIAADLSARAAQMNNCLLRRAVLASRY